MPIVDTRRSVDDFYSKNGPCCAGCDWWRYHNAVVGDCIKNAPVGNDERSAMLGIEHCSLPVGAGHILTRRDHLCGDFVDTEEV